MEIITNEKLKDYFDKMINNKKSFYIEHTIFENCIFDEKLNCIFSANGKIYYYNFMYCEFKKCTFKNIKMTRVAFFDCCFKTCNIIRTTMNDCQLYQDIFIASNFELSKIVDSKILFSTGDKFYKVDFKHTKIANSDLQIIKCENIDIPKIVPETGSFIGWKKACVYDGTQAGEICLLQALIKLQILDDAKRINSFGRKCRCDKAKVLEITLLTVNSSPIVMDEFEDDILRKINHMDSLNNKMEETTIESARSIYDGEFIYRTGEIIKASNFDPDYNECSAGIHFFLTKNEAIEYRL